MKRYSKYCIIDLSGIDIDWELAPGIPAKVYNHIVTLETYLALRKPRISPALRRDLL